ncbi:hypothetical protein ATCC90586_010815 [Pythium insidiosum]|nr:hypothetical protein ATCC90586_010815 [Pythium insidiosum]
MSFAAPSTTNNQAEFHNLLTGLRAAVEYGWRDLDVIGDSALIIRQMRLNSPPKSARLKALYLEARRLADQLGVARWFHQIRAHNEMADALAILAMNPLTSSQAVHPTSRSGHTAITKHLHAQAVANGEPKTDSLKDYCGKYVLVFFYPLDFTFVAEAFRQIGCEVLGCSTDSKFLHLAWINTPRKKGGLGEMQNPLIADYNKEITRAYNVVSEEIENASRAKDRGRLHCITLPSTIMSI